MVLMFFMVAASITSTPPGATAMPAKISLPSLETAMLLGCPLRATLPRCLPVLVSTATTVLSDSTVKYARVPSGEEVTPCGASRSFTVRTTLFVAGSMNWAVSPAALVWMTRTEPAASGSAKTEPKQ